MKSFKSELDKLPDIDEYKANLGSLSQVDFAGMLQEIIGENIYKRTVVLPQIPVNFNAVDFNNGTFYRVRKNIDLTKEDLTSIKTFSYPEPISCNKNGRANLKGKSVFYCSDVAATSILESRLEQNDVIYLGIWQPQVDRDVKAVTLCKKVKRLENGVVKEIELLNPIHSQVSELGIDKSEHLNYLNDFIGNYFITENEPYYVTSWFCNNTLYEIGGVDCIHYQSCITSALSNFAFHPSFINEKYLKLNSVIKLETVIDDHYLIYRLVEIGEVEDDIVKWRQFLDAEKANYHLMIKKGEEIILNNPLVQ